MKKPVLVFYNSSIVIAEAICDPAVGLESSLATYCDLLCIE